MVRRCAVLAGSVSELAAEKLAGRGLGQLVQHLNPQAIVALMRDIGLPNGVADIGCVHADIPETARTAALTGGHRGPQIPVMRIVTLSDHPGDMLADAVSERQRGTARQETVLNDARRRRDQAWARRRWFSWLRLAVAARREARELARQRLSAGRPTGREDSIRAGHDAEQRVADTLGRALNGDWALFRGYRNRRGEIDGLLLGPGGLFAYEVKYHNATVHINGDDWQSEKFDRYGNQVSDRAPIRDKRGRSPSRQLSEPAAMLADWLGKCGHPVSVTPVVLFTHERARIGSIRNPTVGVETSVQGLLRQVERSPGTLTARQRAAIAQIIRDDHRHHQRRA